MCIFRRILFTRERQRSQIKVKHAELGNAACGVRAVVASGSDSNHVESQPWSYLSTDRCYPLCSELKVFQDAAGVQGRGT